MSAKKFLFGDKKQKTLTVADKANYRAESHVERKLMSMKYNSPGAVLLRNKVIKPILKIPFIPLAEAQEIRQKLSLFDKAAQVFSEKGDEPKLRKVRFFEKGFDVKQMIRYMNNLMWRPEGHPLPAEKRLCLKIFGYTITFWAISMVFFAFAILGLFQDGLSPFIKDLNYAYRTYDIFKGLFFGVANSRSYSLFFYSGFFWFVSLVFSVVLEKRKWISHSRHYQNFFREILRIDENKGDYIECLALVHNFIFLDSNKMHVQSIRDKKGGWLFDFLPGEIYNDGNPNDIIIVKRPKREEMVFGGKNFKLDIGSNIVNYDKKILKPMVDSLKGPEPVELLFLGEVIDRNYWKSSILYTTLGENPHCVLIGQSRSGKSKSALSFVYALARAYPDSKFFFADGKSSPDYDIFAEYLSTFPVAKYAGGGDPLLHVANILAEIWAIYLKRQELFEEAKIRGNPCSTIYDFRKQVGKMEQVFFIIDEFSVFLAAMDFEANFKTDGTIANWIKRLIAESASFGIHIIIASQRYQQNDVPTALRANLTTVFFHQQQKTDATTNGVPLATKLKTGQYFVTAPGLYCENTEISQVKAKMPYIGNGGQMKRLFEKTIKKIPKDKKKEFDNFLVYNKGDDDMERMNFNTFHIHLNNFFKNQQYISKRLIENFEADYMHLEIVKGKVFKQDGMDVIKPIGTKRIGVSMMRASTFDADVLKKLQDRKYDAILVFLIGKRGINPVSKFKKEIDNINNGAGAKIYVMPPNEWIMSQSLVESHRKKNEAVDIIQPILEPLGISETQEININNISTKSPLRYKVLAFIKSMAFKEDDMDMRSKQFSYLSVFMPGGNLLKIFTSQDKTEHNDLKDILLELQKQESGKNILLITNDDIQASLKKDLISSDIKVWKVNQLEALLNELKNFPEKTKEETTKEFLSDFKLIYNKQVKVANRGEISIKMNINEEETKILDLTVACTLTNRILYNIPSIDIARFQLAQLNISPGARIHIIKGMAPMGSDYRNITYENSSTLINLSMHSPWEVKGGVLQKRMASIASDDPLLSVFKKD